jgi:hypothetical protein
MDTARPRRLVFTSLVGLRLLGVASFLLINCASGEQTAHSPHGPHKHHPRPPRSGTDGGPPDYIECRSIGDCQESDWFPECGDYDNVTCVAPSGSAAQECIFRVVDEPGCFCLERDIRNCGAGIDAGIQRCVDLGGGETGWGGCGGL